MVALVAAIGFCLIGAGVTAGIKGYPILGGTLFVLGVGTIYVATR